MAKITRVESYKRRDDVTGKTEHVVSYLRTVRDTVEGLKAKAGINTTVTPVTKVLSPAQRAAQLVKPDKHSSLAQVVVNVRARARQVEPHISETLTRVAGENGGHLAGFKNRLKTEESLGRKILDGAVDQGVSFAEFADTEVVDALRYTVVSDPADNIAMANRLVAALIREGNQVDMPDDAYNYWGDGSTYHGINIAVTAPNGLRWELQVHTNDSLVRKHNSHHWYKIFRDRKQPNEVRARARVKSAQSWLGLERPAGWKTFGNQRGGTEGGKYIGGAPGPMPQEARADVNEEDKLDTVKLTTPPLVRLARLHGRVARAQA